MNGIKGEPKMVVELAAVAGVLVQLVALLVSWKHRS
jgi:preprotein translocase subunit Sec61beta